MKDNMKLLAVNLTLFDGEGGAAAEGGTTAGAANTQPGNAGGSGAQNGAQTSGDSDAGSQKQQAPEGVKPEETKKERRARFRAMVGEGGEFYEDYTRETQQMINRRFREVHDRLDAQTPIMDMLLDMYGVADGDLTKLKDALENDKSAWERAADKSGMTAEQYRKFSMLQRENARLNSERVAAEREARVDAQIRAWNTEAEEVTGVYPDFDLRAELENQQFAAMLKSGVSMKAAYEAAHIEDVKRSVAGTAAAQAEEKVVGNIRARGARPAENAITGQGGVSVSKDPSKFTEKEIRDIMKRVANGEVITLRD